MDLRLEAVKSFQVKPITIQEATPIITKWHYSGSTNGLLSEYCFGLFHKSHLIGSMIYGGMGMANVWKKYAEKRDEVIELRRLACIDLTPTNTESYFIGKTLRYLKKNTLIKKVISYADTFHNHTGIIYRASNFTHLGLTNPGRIIKSASGKMYHDKAIRTFYTNKDGVKQLKPFAKRLKEELRLGVAQYINTPGKHIYCYTLCK